MIISCKLHEESARPITPRMLPLGLKTLAICKLLLFAMRLRLAHQTTQRTCGARGRQCWGRLGGTVAGKPLHRLSNHPEFGLSGSTTSSSNRMGQKIGKLTRTMNNNLVSVLLAFATQNNNTEQSCAELGLKRRCPIKIGTADMARRGGSTPGDLRPQVWLLLVRRWGAKYRHPRRSRDACCTESPAAPKLLRATARF